MNPVYAVSSLVTAGLFVYLLIALFKPEYF